jgi:hypothetical protein
MPRDELVISADDRRVPLVPPEPAPLVVGGELRWRLRDLLALGGGFLLLSLGLYWRTLPTGYVYDDWLVLDEVFTSGVLQTLVHHVDPRGLLTYRPIAWIYFVTVAQVSGLSPLTFHLLALIIHATNGVLIAWIGARLTGERTVGIVAAALFIALLSLHLDCFLWLVGFYDIGAMLFTLLSLVTFLKGNSKASAALMGCALLTKEASAFLPVVLFLGVGLSGGRVRDLMYHVAVSIAYGVLKVLGTSPFLIGRENAHAMDASLSVFAGRFTEYLGWLAGSLFPLVKPNVLLMAGGTILLLAIGLLLARQKISTRYMHPRQALFLAGWLLLALMPVLFLKNQSAKYYAVHSAVPLTILLSGLAYEVVARIGRKGLLIPVFAVAVVALSNALFVQGVFRKGIDQVLVNDGYFHLVKRGAVVEAIHESLKLQYPALPHGSLIVLDGVPLDAVGGSRAIRLWYADTTLRMTSSMGLSPGDTTEPGKILTLHLRAGDTAPENNK